MMEFSKTKDNTRNIGVIIVLVLFTCAINVRTETTPPTTVDNCVNNTCANSAVCINGDSNYTCNCPTGWQGWLCDTDVDDCTPSSCSNNGTCVDNGTNSVNCSCTSGWEGPTCTQDVNDCNPNPCSNNGTCMDLGTNSFNCTCPTGWLGANCSQVDNCVNNSCANGAVCINRDSNYTCNCTTGWQGWLCDTDVNDCNPSPCQHGACNDTGINSYSCNCTTGYLGLNCSQVDHCVNNTCANGAVCINGDSNYTCDCTTGWQGWICETDVNDCMNDTCLNDGVCTDNGTNSFICNCTRGWMGKTCTEDVNECADNPCNNGTCSQDMGSGDYNCTCPVDFRGKNCDLVKNDCEPNPCYNNITCTDGIADFTCDCPSTLTGKTCHEDVKECSEEGRCLNGGYCQELMGDYDCICEKNWKGDNCSEDVNECSDQCNGPGMNCTNTEGSFLCECSPGYMMKGATCIEMMILPNKENAMKYMMKNEVVGPISVDCRIPYFNNLYHSIYVSMNGYLSLGQKYVNRYPPKNLSDWSDSSKFKILAPYWWHIDLPDMRNDTGLYISQWKAIEEMDKAMIDKVSTIVSESTEGNFTAEMIFMATWQGVTPYPATEFSTLAGKFQVIITSDGKQSFAIINYDKIWKESAERMVKSFLTGSTTDMIKMIPTPGNNIRRVIPLYDMNQMVDNTDFECINKLSMLPEKGVDTAMCPCTLEQAHHDLQFNQSSNSTMRTCFTEYLAHDNMHLKCCYEKTRGSLLGYNEMLAGFGVYSNRTLANIQSEAYAACCSDTSSKCFTSFFTMFQPSTCSNYTHKLALIWGDPHIVGLDETDYTFNGNGEYSLLKNTNMFEIQSRMSRVQLMANDKPGNATVFVGVASKMSTGSVTLEFMSNSADLDFYVDGVKSTDYQDEMQMVMKSGNSYVVIFMNRISLKITPFDGYMSGTVYIKGGNFGTTSGLLGNANGDMTDGFKLRNNTVLPHDSTESSLFTFGTSWLVQDEASSLFNYTLIDGNFTTNQHPEFMPMFYRDMSSNLTMLFNGDNNTQQTAMALCNENIPCLVDYAVTGSGAFANSTKMEYEMFMQTKSMFVNTPPMFKNPMYWNYNTGESTQMLNVMDAESNSFTVTINTTINETLYTFNETSREFKLIIKRETVMMDWFIKFTATDEHGASSLLQPVLQLCLCNKTEECLPSMINTGFVRDQPCNCSANHEGRYCEIQKDVCKQCYDMSLCNTTNQENPCSCPEGLIGDGISCYDVDECLKDNECNHDCLNTIGNYTCSCRHGYKLMGKGMCQDIDECKTVTMNNCTDGEYCSNIPGGFTCNCKAMYKRNSANKCEKVAAIFGGTFVFDSVPGVQKWMPELEDKTSEEFKNLASTVETEVTTAIDSSNKLKDHLLNVMVIRFYEYNTSSRRKRATESAVKIEANYEISFSQPIAVSDLHNSINSGFTCSGDSCSFGSLIGVSKNGSMVQDEYDLCAEDFNNNCHKSSTTCQTLNGTFTCACRPGYKPWDLAANTCEDIDECMGSDGNETSIKMLCGDEGIRCVNQPGTYTCDCRGQYEYDMTTKKCTLVDYCKSSPCKNDATCVNVRAETNYACKCTYGYTGQNCQEEDLEAMRQRTIIIAVSVTLGLLCLLLLIALCVVCASSRKKSHRHSINMEEYSTFKGLPRAHLRGEDNAMMENGSTQNLYEPDNSLKDEKQTDTDKVTSFNYETLERNRHDDDYGTGDRIYADPAVPF
ncbi:mucin-like protein isoform X2 [Patella vulgata]|uniref:mucin-like protein isoform X2 n=1 Tax=Patella vulgata TaxID=6465 RepID=UPI0024A88643|nr:mucin-like protein isoform X2 [Patella vulgata]